LALLAAPDTMVLVPSRAKQRNVPKLIFFLCTGHQYPAGNKGITVNFVNFAMHSEQQGVVKVLGMR
jgi:hypothetical protein